MEGIGSADAVTTHPDRPRVLAALKANAEALAADGAVGLSTSCGFLALYQDDLAALSPVPVATSALLLIKRLTGRKVGVLTASARNLTPAHFAAVGAPTDTPFDGLPDGQLVRRDLPAQRPRRSIATRSSARSWRPAAICWRSHPGIDTDRARMHQPAAVQERGAGGPRPAGVRRARPAEGLLCRAYGASRRR